MRESETRQKVETVNVRSDVWNTQNILTKSNSK